MSLENCLAGISYANKGGYILLYYFPKRKILPFVIYTTRSTQMKQ